MRKEFFAFMGAAALALAACGGGENQQNQGQLPDNLASVIFNRMVDDAATSLMMDSSMYSFGNTVAHFQGEDLCNLGNYIAYGCYPKKDGDVLVVRYSLVQHFNFKATYFPPEVSFFNYKASGDSLYALTDREYFVIDSADFVARNPFVCDFTNNLYYEFDSQGIVVRYIKERGVPPIRYNWNGESFVKVPVGVDYKDGIFADIDWTEFNPELFRGGYFTLKDNGILKEVYDPNGDWVASLTINAEDKIEMVSFHSKMYKVGGLGMRDILDENATEWKDYIVVDNDNMVVSASRSIGKTNVSLEADINSRRITGVDLVLGDNKVASALFEVPASEPLDATGRAIWSKVLEMKLFPTREGVEFRSAGSNWVGFSTYELSMVWDYSEFRYCYNPQMAYFKMNDGNYKVYLVETLIYDEYDQANLRYTAKERKLAKAFVYDGNALKECAFDLPDPTANNLPSNTDAEYDPVGAYSFSGNGVSVCYDEVYEDGTDAEGGEA
ncbi:MAG: hypothetical protein MJZ66_11010, partial [Bacteroidales bacterium]|nr:hypothetical protein [Bacteroidales bacterium]